jgi:hypothetical protein
VTRAPATWVAVRVGAERLGAGRRGEPGSAESARAGSPAADRTNVEIEVIEDALMAMEPVEGLNRLLRRGPGRRLADDCMPRLARTGGAAD